VLRSLNRMNDLIPVFRFEGTSTTTARTSTPPSVDPVVVRRYIGMVFQQPNPFSMSIFDNVAFGLRLNKFKGDYDEKVREGAARRRALEGGQGQAQEQRPVLSGGQQQRLCIARAIATEPDVLLMDEPCSALDPIATRQVEELMLELKERYTIALVTHNMQQAHPRRRHHGLLLGGHLPGRPHRLSGGDGPDTQQLFENPQEELDQGIHPRRVQLPARHRGAG
jgi:phosphate transport system ATP-binding protein